MRISLLIILFLATVSPARAVPSFQEVKDSYKTSDALLLDRHGEVIHELRIDPKGRRLEWVHMKDISPSLIRAVIYSEDRRFFKHHGVDWWALGSTALKNIFSSKPRGASTITMQLTSILDKDLKPKAAKRTLGQKWNQMKAALRLEKEWSKEQILEAYLNLITFRGELQGIASASRGLFDKEPSGLDEAESCMLATLVRSPNAPVDMVTKRACILAESLGSPVQCEQIKSLAEYTLARPPKIRQLISLAPHVARELLLDKRENIATSSSKHGSVKIISTLDGNLQCFASEVLRHQIRILSNQNVRDGAVLVVENKTGEVLAYAANTGSGSSASRVDGIKARRQAGSTLKPFLYALALEKRIMTAASLIDDVPLDVPTERGIYRPENYDREFRDVATVREALGSSLNIPAVNTISLTGVDSFVRVLRVLGFHDLRDDEFYGPSLALGSADVSLWDLVNAYRALANGGIRSDLKLSPDQKSKRGKRIFSEEVSFVISDILSDREARSSTFSLENPLSTKFWSAVKTGTSKDMRDNWCIGYSEKYTVGVWVGNFSGDSMWNVSGVSGAAPAWLEVMNYLHRNTLSASPVPPSGLVRKDIAFQRGSFRREWFLQGTEPGDVVRFASSPNQKIVYPPNDSTITIDPDIPLSRQRIVFESEFEPKSMKWMLNGITMGNTKKFLWTPERGSHELVLIDSGNRVMDRINFRVK